MSLQSVTSSSVRSGQFETVNRNVENENVLGQHIPLVYHYNMLLDEDRVRAFREAIETVVQPGMHVVELGGGTGILSSFAARRGATVTCVERIPQLAECATKFVRDNALSEAVKVVQADAASFVPQAPVDVVICEMLHVGLLREKQLQVIAGFKRGYMKKFGNRLPIFLPEASILMAQPVEQSFDFHGYWAPIPTFQATLNAQPRTRELCGLSAYANIDYQQDSSLVLDHCEKVTAIQTGIANAVRFVTQNVLAVSVEQQRAITWPNQSLIIPIVNPVHVNAGQVMQLAFRYAAGDSVESLSDSIELSLVANQSEPRALESVD